MRRLFRFLANGLMSIIRKPRLLVEIATVILAALIWFAGPFFGIESVEARVKLIIGLSVFRVLVNILDHYLAFRKSSQLEASLQQQAVTQMAQARPDRKEEIAALSSQFETAVASLKSSKLGKGHQGKAALYALPWYMFIGPPASGKSTALRQSGLQFPYMGGSGQGLQGLGGTRNCDWWFTNEAVLLDTAGRYVTQEEDQDEWLGFLDLLKKYRKGKPINGVMAVISVSDLLEASEEDIEAHAKKIRGRIDELVQRLGMVFPVYLIFTKCDLVQGFVEFFEDLTKAEREQVWGCTFGVADSAHQASKATFKAEFHKLFEAIQGRRLPRLANARGTHKINIFGFPLQFEALQDKCAHFVEALFQANPYHENPLFRGFYFSSGTQEGAPIDRILGKVSQEAGLSRRISSSFVPTEMKSYFLKDLFTSIIFPDQGLASPSSALHRQQGYLRLAVFAAAVLLVLTSVTGFVFSYLGNKQLLSGVLASAVSVPPQALVDEQSVESNIEFFDGLGSRFTQVRGYEEQGVPVRLWGLYQGDRLVSPLRDVYVKHFTRIFLDPTRHYMETALRDYASGFGVRNEGQGSEQYYAMLKAYIMMGDPQRLKASFVASWLTERWTQEISGVYGANKTPKWVEQGLDRQMTLYSEHVAGVISEKKFPLNRRLIPLVQERLRQVPVVKQIYALGRAEAIKKYSPYSLAVALGNPNQVSLVNEYSFSGLFTLEGWQQGFQNVFTTIIEDASQEVWVLGKDQSYGEELEDGVEELYFTEYVSHWRTFLQELRIRPTATPADTERMLKDISQPNSPIIQILKVVDRNTMPGAEGMDKLKESASNLFEKAKGKAKELIGLDADEPRAPVEDPLQGVLNTEFSRQVSVHFQSLHALTIRPDKEEALSPMDQYVGEIGKVHRSIQTVLRTDEVNPETKMWATKIIGGEESPFTDAFKTTELLLSPLDAEANEIMIPLLYQPMVAAMGGIMDRAKAQLDKQWEAEVYQICQRNISEKYPFKATGDDAALQDVVEFLNPDDGVLWKFYNEELKPFVVEGTEQWESRPWHGVSLQLSSDSLEALRYAHLVSESLFGRANSEFGNRFEVKPYPPQGEGRRAIGDTKLEVGGKELRYGNEPQEWHPMEWPGPSRSEGARLHIQVQKDGEDHEGQYIWRGLEHDQVWGLFRLLDRAEEVKEESDNLVRAKWDIQFSGNRRVDIQYDIKTDSYKNPFRNGMLQGFRCAHTL